MTLRKKVEIDLIENGLWPDQAAEVVNQVAISNSNSNIRWNDPSGNYPPMMLFLLLKTARKKALEILRATKPEHFAISNFENIVE